MLYGIISDIHGNLEALTAVLERLQDADRIICLGDIIGYGPNPNECVEKIRELNIPSVAGNHEKALLGEVDVRWFNKNAADAINWTKNVITQDNQEYIKKLPLVLAGEDFQCVHGSLRDPAEEYVTNVSEAIPTFALMAKPLLFIGHSHSPIYIAVDKDGNYEGKNLHDGDEVLTENYQKVIINAGGVGQPRDRDPRASFGLFNSKNKVFTLQRAEYAIEKVQEKMRAAGLPQFLIERLSLGK